MKIKIEEACHNITKIGFQKTAQQPSGFDEAGVLQNLLVLFDFQENSNYLTKYKLFFAKCMKISYEPLQCCGENLSKLSKFAERRNIACA